ncbi:MAG: ATP-binding protein [Chloroflexota bacterium]
MSNAEHEYYRALVTELRRLPAETGWFEFKQNNVDPEGIGKYLSALSNTAVLEGRANAYVVWGIEDGTHRVTGTEFHPDTARRDVGSLESWLLQSLSPKLDFRFVTLEYEQRRVVILEIPRASDRPVQFKGVEYIRVGLHRQVLKEHPQLERRLWRLFDTTPFEELRAAENLAGDDVLTRLDYASYFDPLGGPPPGDRDGVLKRLAADRLVRESVAGGWDVLNLGAILFAKDLGQFRSLERKAVRVVVYRGPGRLDTEREHVEMRGYATGFEGLIDWINARLPRNELIGRALRKEVPMYPELAVRELVANALIHQDFSITGAGPMIEIFVDRMEITNPGEPLVDTARFLDHPPRSRNETLASAMRRIGICEERGSGVDKVVAQTELFQLPAPSFESPHGSTRAVLFAHKPLTRMDKVERVRACYLHACLRFVQREQFTNSSLRERFGIRPQNLATASRIIRETLEEGLIKPYDPDQSKKMAKYVPYWA